MCGIAGFINAEHSRDDAEQLIDRMCQIIRHRGPDDQGTWVGEGVALGMRRLSIIDLAYGHQPIFNEDQSILIVFNGEIYNYRELQKELEERGHRFATNSDTETIVHAYEEYGDDCVRHLRGMFTFAIWDRNRQRLLAARDRFGKKPLNYYWDGQRLIFGSEIKSILEAGIPREINHIALDEYLVYSCVATPNTLFKDDDFSDLPYARQVAQHFGTDHHEFFVRPELISVLPQLVWAYDEPFADASMLPAYYVSKLAREHVSVVLTGDGGDEIFGGYSRYAGELSIHRIPAFLRFLLGCGGMLMPDGMRGKKRLSIMRG